MVVESVNMKEILRKFRKFKKKFFLNLYWSLRWFPLGTSSLNLQKTQWEKGRKSNDSRLYMCARMTRDSLIIKKI